MSVFRPIAASTTALCASNPTGTPVGWIVTPRCIAAGFANLSLTSDLSR